MAPSNTLNKSDIIWDEPVSAAPPKDAIIWDAPAPDDPGLGKVALNAVPKGVANLLHTPAAVGNLLLSGLSNLPFAGHFDTLKNLQQEQMPNVPMEVAEKTGLVDPAKNPQTPVQRVVDSLVQTGIGAAAGPGGMVRNMATGAVAGGAGQVAKEATDSDIARFMVSTATPLVLRSTARPNLAKQNAVRDQTYAQGREAGYVLPPSETRPTWLNNRLESVSGKAAIKQEASLRNQAITDALARKSLGVQPNAPLTGDTFNQVRKKAGKVYDELDDLRPTPDTPWFPRYHDKDLVNQLKTARDDARNAWKAFDRNPTNELRDQAKSLDAHAASIEQDLAMLAKANNKEQLIKELAESRKQIAKAHDIEAATNLGDASVSAPMVGAMLNKGKPLSGELELIGKYQQAFPKFMGEGARIPAPGVSGTDMPMAAALTIGGQAAHPAGWLAGGLPFLRGPARSLALSPGYQRFFAQPDYGGLSAGDKGANAALIAALLASRQQGGQ